jgi:hypothetical protein
MPLIKKIVLKYLNTFEHHMATMTPESDKTANRALIEISSKFVSRWDFNK